MTGDIFFILILLLCIGILLVVGVRLTTHATEQQKEDAELKCPSRAQYSSLGLITSEPDGKVFTSLESYKQYYKYLASMGLQCSFVSPSRDESLLQHKPAKGVEVSTEDEQTYALTPIKKLDD